MTPARLAANRRNAQRSTGPRSERGKSRSRLNHLRNGSRSPSYDALFKALLVAAPGKIYETSGSMLTPEEATHPLFASLIEELQKSQEFAFEHSAAFRRVWSNLRHVMGKKKKRRAFEATKSIRIRAARKRT